MINVEIIGDYDPFWDQVHSSDLYSIYHTKIWKNLIEETFKHTSMYIAASNKGNPPLQPS